MINRTLRVALESHAAEYDLQQSKKEGYRNNGALHGYLAAINEMDELIECGETLEEAFNASFDEKLRKFLLPAFNKYKNY